MTQAPQRNEVAVELSLDEALTVLAALRQYYPSWSSSSPLSMAEQLASVRRDVDSVIGKLRAAAAEPAR